MSCLFAIPAKTCRDPGLSDHAIRVGSSLLNGAQVRYSCEAGYNLKGASIITCHDTVWTARRPSCERKFTYMLMIAFSGIAIMPESEGLGLLWLTEVQYQGHTKVQYQGPRLNLDSWV